MMKKRESLLEETTRLLDESQQSIPQIARGADVGIHWLRKFREGAFLDPGVNRVERLNQYLRISAT